MATRIATMTMVLAWAGSMTIGSARVQAQWHQWGGPQGNFVVESGKLAEQWPESGPPVVWQRDLGDGYSAIAVDDGMLFTTYRHDDDEVVVALDAHDGKTQWEHTYEAPIGDGYEKRFGVGPHATPLVIGDNVYTLGFTAKLHCLNKKTGKVVWSKDTVSEFGVKAPVFGASSSPIAHKGNLLIVLGGENSGMASLSLATGEVNWKRHTFENMYSSPIIINVGGQEQVALLTSDAVVGINPDNGDLLWQQEHLNQWKTNIPTPVFAKDNTLYVSSGGDAGARMFKLSRDGSQTTIEEVWKSRKMQVSQGNAIRVNSMVFGSAGDQAAFLGAADAKTGKVVWRERGYAKATMIHADGKLIILDEDGVLALARPKADQVEILAKFQLFKDRAWSAPTLVGKKLYVRDQKTIIALDLG